MDDVGTSELLRKVYSPTQIGGITQFVSPLGMRSSLEEAHQLFMSDESLSSIPIEDDDGRIVGLIDREEILAKAKSFWEKLKTTDIHKFIRYSPFVIQGRENIERLIHMLFEQHSSEVGRDLLVFKNNREYLGVVNFFQMLRYSSAIRDQLLSQAREVQEFYIGRENLAESPYPVHLFLKMAHEVGGDLFQYRKLDEKRSMFACFDVSGKNFSASLSTSMLSSCLTTLEMTGALSRLSTLELVRTLHEIIRKQTPLGIFIAAGIVVFDRSQRKFEIANLGFCPMYLRLEGDQGRREWKRITSKMPPLGLHEDSTEYASIVTVQIPTNASIFMFSDGLTDARNEEGTMYGEEQLEEFIAQNRQLPPVEFIGTIEKTITEYVGNAPQADDITAVMVHFPIA